MRPRSPETERRALALVERLTAEDTLTIVPDELAAEPPEVQARVAELMRGFGGARAAMPTEVPDATPAPPPPERIGAFRLESLLGAGGMGQVWRARRVEGGFDQRVAIKLIHSERFSEAAVGRFDAERRILARLDHPGIARIIDGGRIFDEGRDFDYGTTGNGQPWLAMEYVEGLPLDAWAAANAPTLEQKVALMRRVCEAVQAAHEQLVVHADLKPGNILVRADGSVKLLDFGIARLIAADDGDGVEEISPLTRAFASPRRLEGAPPAITDDVYALGVMLRRIDEAATDPDLAAIAGRAADPDDARRYGSVEALSTDLCRWAQHLPVAARPLGAVARGRLFVRRHRTGVALTAAAMAMLLAISLFATFAWIRAERARADADARFAEVHRLSRFMLYDLYDELGNAPGTTVARTRIAATSGAYLDRLRVSRGAPADLLLDAASGYRRLAMVEGVPDVTSLGRSRAALRSLDKAEALLTEGLAARPDDPALLEEQGWVDASRWTLRIDNVHATQVSLAARRWFDRALAIEPGRPGALLGRITTEKNEAYDMIWANRAREAMPILRRALARLRAIDVPPALRQTARLLETSLLNRLGDAHYYAGDIPASLPFYRQAGAIVDAELARKANTPVWLNRKGEVEWNLSGSLNDSGRPTEALAAADRGIAALDQVLAYGPDSNAEKQLLMIYNQKADVLRGMNRNAEAVLPAALSVALRERRYAAEPADPERRRDLALGYPSYALILVAAGRRADACREIGKAARLWTEIRRARNLTSLDAGKSVPEFQAVERQYCAG